MSVRALKSVASSVKRWDGTYLGWVTEFNEEQGWLVDFIGNPGPPLVARLTTTIPPSRGQQAAAMRQQAILIFENSDPALPIVIGLVQSSTPIHDETEAHIDGQRVVLEAENEVVLRCGAASITLRRNGAIIIKGAHLISHSSGINRIRGGSLEFN